MKKLFIIMLLVLFSSCSNMDEENTNEDNTILVSKLISNQVELSTQCVSLCRVDSLKYCLEERELIINEKSIFGTCRSFSKYNFTGFERCEKFCKRYGDETGCKLDNGSKDSNCDWI